MKTKCQASPERIRTEIGILKTQIKEIYERDRQKDKWIYMANEEVIAHAMMKIRHIRLERKRQKLLEAGVFTGECGMCASGVRSNLENILRVLLTPKQRRQIVEYCVSGVDDETAAECDKVLFVKIWKEIPPRYVGEIPPLD